MPPVGVNSLSRMMGTALLLSHAGWCRAVGRQRRSSRSCPRGRFLPALPRCAPPMLWWALPTRGGREMPTGRVRSAVFFVLELTELCWS